MLKKFNLPILWCFVFFCAITSENVFAQLKGSYTIDASKSASATNYKSFSAAVSDLSSGSRSDGGTANGAGVSGAVTFFVASGTYTEQISIPAIKGASATNTITFEGGAGNASSRIITYAATDSTKPYTIQLIGAKHIRIQHLTIAATGKKWGWAVHLYNNGTQPDSNLFKACSINTPTTSVRSLKYSFYGLIANANQAAAPLPYGFSQGQFNDIEIDSNSITGGKSGIYIYNSYSLSGIAVRITNNIISTAQDTGICATAAYSCFIKGNTITMDTMHDNSCGIYVNQTSDNKSAPEISNNIISGAGRLGICIQYGYSDQSGHRGLIYNNIISGKFTAPDATGIRISDAYHWNIYHNTVLLDGSFQSNYSAAAISLIRTMYGSIPMALDVRNNQFIVGKNKAKTYALWSSDTSNIQYLDYNNYYNNSALNSYFLFISRNVPAANFKGALSFNLNSYTVYPSFTSSTDLTPGMGCLKGIYFPAFSTDIKNISRSNPPEIGAIEANSSAKDDIGVIAITSPAAPFTTGNHDITVSIKNFGSNTVTSASISYVINGTVQTSSWTGSLSACGTTTFTFSGTKQYNFSSKKAYRIQAYTSSPNGNTDGDANNDTFAIRVSPALQGSYTINNTGTGSADFTSFSDAVDALNYGSITGPVIFNVVPSTYTEHIVLGPIAGASSKNTITFEGIGKDSTQDTITWKTDKNISNGNTYIVKLTNAHDISFEKMTFCLPGSTAANAVECFGTLNNVTFLHNNFYADSLSSGTHVNIGVGIDSNFIFRGNRFYGGLAGVYFINYSTTPNGGNFLLDSNRFLHQSIYAAEFEYTNSIKLLSNYFIGEGGSYQPINLYGVTGFTISKNRILSQGRGIALLSDQCTSTNPGLVSNNFVSVWPITYSTNALIAGAISNINVYNNTFLVSTSSPTNSYAVYFSSTLSNFNFKNNILLVRGADTTTTCLNIYDHTKIKSDYNDFYLEKGTILVTEGTSSIIQYRSLSNWQTAAKQDSNSMYADPMLIMPDKVYVKNKKLGGAGKNLAPLVVDDINGAKRPNVPAIGAIEPTFIYNDAGITAFVMDSVVCEGSSNLVATIKNYGLNPLKSATVHWMINNSSATLSTYSYSGSIIIDKTDTKIIGTYPFKPGIYQLKAWTTKPNGVTDSVIHDTAYFRIRVIAKPSSKITGSNSVCVNSTVLYYTPKNNGNKYSWLLKGKGSIANSTKDSVTITFNGVGTDTVVVIETNAIGCSDSAFYTVTVNALPKAKWRITKACVGNAVHFMDSSTLAVKYFWSFGDGSTDTIANPLHIYTKAGSYNVMLEVISAVGCEDFLFDTIVIDTPPKAGFSFSEQCLDDSTIFTDSSISAASYIWHFGDGDSSLAANPKHKFTKAGAYRVHLLITSSGGCIDSISSIVIINNKPKANFSFSGLCISDSTSFIDSSVSAKNYSWYFGDGSTSAISSPKHKYTSAGKYQVTLVTTNASGCIDSISKYVTIDSSCVWPGDANADKIVDAKDVLSIGIAYGDTGSKRADTSTTWSAHMCKDWSGTFLSGKNYKHADCNGDGVVNDLDTNAITLNYSRTHAKTGFSEQGDPTDPAFNIVFEKNRYSEGDTIKADIYLGSSAKPVNNAYGLAFSLVYDPGLVQQGYMVVNFSNSWLGTKGTNLISYSKNHFNKGQLDLAIVRTDHKNITGYGKIGTVSLLVAKTLTDSNKAFSFGLSDNKLISFNETEIPVFTYSDTTQVKQKKVGIAESVKTENMLKVFPNPFSNNTNIAYSLNENETVQLAVFDINGNVVSTLVNSQQPAGQYMIAFDASQHKLSSGIYYVKCIFGSKLVIQKLILTN